MRVSESRTHASPGGINACSFGKLSSSTTSISATPSKDGSSVITRFVPLEATATIKLPSPTQTPRHWLLSAALIAVQTRPSNEKQTRLVPLEEMAKKSCNASDQVTEFQAPEGGGVTVTHVTLSDEYINCDEPTATKRPRAADQQTSFFVPTGKLRFVQLMPSGEVTAQQTVLAAVSMRSPTAQKRPSSSDQQTPLKKPESEVTERDVHVVPSGEV